MSVSKHTPEKIPVFVNCPITGRQETLYFYYLLGHPDTLLTNGCDSLCGASVCAGCQAEQYAILLEELKRKSKFPYLNSP